MTFIYQHGLAVMRAQPFHIGHQRLVSEMLAKCVEVTLLLGSVQECGTPRNPFDFITRKQMILNCCQSPKLHVLGLTDIYNPMKWADYVLEQVALQLPELPKPDVYFAGSDYDAHWFEGKIGHIELVDRNNPKMPFVSATMVRDMLKYGDKRWKNFVPAENIKLIEEVFDAKIMG